MAVEVYDQVVGRRLAAHFAASLARSSVLSLEQWRRRGLGRRLRDACFWIFSPSL
jgi:hypothetical protein